MDKPEYIPLILDYSDDGLQLEDIDAFIDSIKAFKKEVAERYKGQKTRIYFLPKEMITMMIDSNAPASGLES